MGAGIVLFCLSPSWASTITDTITRAGDWLVNNQSGSGTWTGESVFQGTMVSGLANAFLVTTTPAYKTAAENGANWILTNEGGNFYGDEAYGLTRVSDLQATPAVNAYRAAVLNYYNVTVPAHAGGTSGYINDFVNHYTTTFNEQSQAVILLSYHTLAAYYVGANDEATWRSGLINALGQVDDADLFPVCSLGAAVWALAATGNGMSNSTTISGPSTVLNGMTLAQLPDLLKSQIMAADPFYYDFGHTGGGYTEDTALGLLGLEAAVTANPSLNYVGQIYNSQLALSDAVGLDGTTYVDVDQSPPSHYVYAGRALQALAPIPEPSGILMLVSAGVLCVVRRRRQPLVN